MAAAARDRGGRAPPLDAIAPPPRAPLAPRPASWHARPVSSRPSSPRFPFRRVVAGVLVAAAPLLLASTLLAADPPAPHGRGGAVASDEPLATEVGLAILRDGGNAVDAAVATALALAVVHPEAGNLLGGGFAVVRVGGELAALDFRETGPAAATATMYLDARGQPRPGASTVGPLAAGVPGTPTGLAELHRRFGKLAWGAVVAPAERLARGGFALSRRTARSLEKSRELLARFPSASEVWLPGGAPLAAGSAVQLPALADTLADYARRGAVALTEGPRAAAVVAASSRQGGILTAADLAAYRPAWREPLRFERLGWSFVTMPLPSSGGIVLGEALALLERTGWTQEPRGGAERAHRFAEAYRRAFADRFLLGDPASTRANVAELIAPDWLDRRAAGVDRQRATPSALVQPYPQAAPVTAPVAAPAPGALASESRREPTETTHLSVVDGEGNLVALTTTLNELFGCGLFVAEVGAFLNNEMDDFTAAPGRPNTYGIIQGEANRVAAGHRMLSSMSPTLALHGNEAIVLGGRGGSRIATATAQVLLSLLVDGDELQAAVDRPRLHHQWLPDRLEAETDALSPETRTDLERRGHALVPATSTAKVNAVRLLPDGTLTAAADPRGPGGAGVVRPLP